MYYAKFKADQAKAEEVKDFYHATEINNDATPYEYFLTKKNGITIHAFKNKKEIYTIVFSSEDDKCVEEANFFSNDVSITKTVQKETADTTDYFQNWKIYIPRSVLMKSVSATFSTLDCNCLLC